MNDRLAPRILDHFDLATELQPYASQHLASVLGGGITSDDTNRWSKLGYFGPGVDYIDPDGRVRHGYLPSVVDDFTREYLVTGLVAVCDALSNKARTLVLQAQRERKLAAHVIQRLTSVLTYDPDRLDESALHLLDGAESVRFGVHKGGLVEMEIVQLPAWVGRHRDQARSKLETAGARSPEQIATATRDIVALEDWRRLQEAIEAGETIAWVESKGINVRRRKGSSEQVHCYGPSRPWSVQHDRDYGFGLTPIPQTLVDELITSNAEFQRAMNEGRVRMVPAPSTNGKGR
jgi:hypothetical protein